MFNARGLRRYTIAVHYLNTRMIEALYAAPPRKLEERRVRT